MPMEGALNCIIIIIDQVIIHIQAETIFPWVLLTLVSTHVISWIAIMSIFPSALDSIVKDFQVSDKK